MDLVKLTKVELLAKCQELGISRCSSKTKGQLIELIEAKAKVETKVETKVELEVKEKVDTKVELKEQGKCNSIGLPQGTSVNLHEGKGQGLRFVDLFCGIGGFHQAMKRLDGTCVFACDIDEKCRETYEKNYGLKPHADITKVNVAEIPDFDVLCAGFPCQAFSNSGKKKGFDDKRGRLYEYILDIATAKRPAFLFLENVKHIKKIDDGKVFEEIMRRIKETGYTAHITELSPHQLGVPQQRERVIFTCIRNDIYDPAKSLEFPLPNVPINVGAIFETDPAKTAKYRISKDDEAILSAWDEMVKHMETGQNMSPTILCNEFGKAYSETEFAELVAWRREYITKNKPIYEKYKAQWDAWREKYRALLTKKEIYGKLEWQAGIKKENDSIFNHFIQLRQSGIRVKKTDYFPTLVAIVQTPIYAKEKRYITPRECARLQSFPDDFIMCENDHTAYKQFGNAVNVDVVHFMINNVLKLYGR